MIDLKKDIQINIPNGKEWKRWIIYVLLVLAYTFILVSLTDYIQNVKVWKITMYAVDLIKILPAIWYIRKLELKKQDFFGGKNMAFQVLIGAGAGVLCAVIVSIPDIIRFQGSVYVVKSSGSIFFEIFNVFYQYFIIAALFEEIIFRIAMQEGLSRLMGRMKILAPLIVGIIFGLWHYPVYNDWSQVLITGISGTLFGYLRMYFGWNIVALVLEHGLYDILAVYLPIWLIRL